LEEKGTPIGAHEMLIAAHTRALDAVCVTERSKVDAAWLAEPQLTLWRLTRVSEGWWT
jgi:hypothetical protein